VKDVNANIYYILGEFIFLSQLMLLLLLPAVKELIEWNSIELDLMEFQIFYLLN